MFFYPLCQLFGFLYEVLADTLGEANPMESEDTDGLMEFIDRLAVDAHKRDDDTQVALAYDAGIGKGYIGFSESLRLLSKRISRTGIKSISFSDQDNIARLYVDAAAINSKVKGPRFEKCTELVNVIAEADVLSADKAGHEPAFPGDRPLSEMAEHAGVLLPCLCHSGGP